METHSTDRKPVIYLNGFDYKEKSLIKLFFRPNKKIVSLLQGRDWIKYSVTYRAYVTHNNERCFCLLADLFSNTAILDRKYLERRMHPKAETVSIGNNSSTPCELEHQQKNSTVFLLPLKIEEKEYINIRYKYSREIYTLLKKSGFCSWSKEYKSWIIPASKDDMQKLISLLIPVVTVRTHSSLQIHDVSLRKQLLEQSYCKTNGFITCPDEYLSLLQYRNYSYNTIKTYHYLLLRFFNSFKGKTLKEINEFTETEINKYHEIMREEKSISSSMLNQSVNAIAFYYRNIIKREVSWGNFIRPKKEKRLPDVYSLEDVQIIVNCIENKKHRAVIFLIYSAGLRVSESLNLKITDILSDRKQIFVRGSKGRKDRMAQLSVQALTVLRDYYREFKPEEYLFRGQFGGKYSASSIRKVFEKAKKAAGIDKPGSIHTLRHSYATHLLENGTDIRYIQTFLGHNSSRTTEIYTHISKAKTDKIISPGDLISLK
ncbi:MAG: tyrosine-type recombinase/integrase [Bacteroidia bacterium]|nr:tyrosine-type recombinase/integrase [Bacteroidia bacterium]